jgi:hypothetical protein
MLKSMLDSRPQVCSSGMPSRPGDGHLSPPRARQKSPLGMSKILYDGFNLIESKQSKRKISTADSSFDLSRGINNIAKNIGEGNEDHFQMGHKASCVNINVVESWLNETLREAEYFGLPSTFKKKQLGSHKALYDYAIDRMTLTKAGISH